MIERIESPGARSYRLELQREGICQDSFPVGTRVLTGGVKPGTVTGYTKSWNLIVKWDEGGTISGIDPDESIIVPNIPQRITPASVARIEAQNTQQRNKQC